MGNVALTFEGKHGETAAIVDRCICETAILIAWLCEADTPDRIRRYVANGLRPELELKQQIENAIDRRAGDILEIENRMLGSIDRAFSAATLSYEDVENQKKLPQVAQMIESLGYSRLEYTVSQRIGSHHVHGSWPSLLFHYLERSDLEGWDFLPRGTPSSMHINQYVQGSRYVLMACQAYVDKCFKEDGGKPFGMLITDTMAEIIAHYEIAISRGA